MGVAKAIRVFRGTPRPAGMPDSGGPALHLEDTTVLPPGAWLIVGVQTPDGKRGPGLKKSRNGAPQGAVPSQGTGPARGNV